MRAETLQHEQNSALRLQQALTLPLVMLERVTQLSWDVGTAGRTIPIEAL